MEGELDNTQPGRVVGWMRFAGLNEAVTFELTGNFHRDIRGAKIRFTGRGDPDDQNPKHLKTVDADLRKSYYLELIEHKKVIKWLVLNGIA